MVAITYSLPCAMKGGYRDFKKNYYFAILLQHTNIYRMSNGYKRKGLISRAGCMPYNPRLKERSRALRTSMTAAEKKLWKGFLRQHPLTFHRQKPLDHYIVDFYCSTVDLVIEIDGDSHSSTEAKSYDAERTHILQGYGLQVLRFSNEDVFLRFAEVCATIEDYIQKVLASK